MLQPVLLLGAGRAAHGGYPLARIAAVRPVVLVDTSVPGWARPYLSGHLAADPAREAETAETVARYAARHPVAGLVTWDRAHLTVAARTTARLGLPGLPYETAAVCADPPALRALLLRNRVVPAGPEDADGPLVSAETVVLDDEVRITALTRTTSLGHSVHAHDPLLHNRFVRRTVERTVRALGLGHAVAHVGLRLPERGPRVTGVSPHLPGDLIPWLVERATGVDLVGAALALACGAVPDVTPTRQRAAAIRFADGACRRASREYWVVEGADALECERALDAA
ncbi:hypothetical protein [Streptomyces sp. NPDC001135]